MSDCIKLILYNVHIFSIGCITLKLAQTANDFETEVYLRTNGSLCRTRLNCNHTFSYDVHIQKFPIHHSVVTKALHTVIISLAIDVEDVYHNTISSCAC